jgi:hypothetical protein
MDINKKRLIKKYFTWTLTGQLVGLFFMGLVSDGNWGFKGTMMVASYFAFGGLMFAYMIYPPHMYWYDDK